MEDAKIMPPFPSDRPCILGHMHLLVSLAAQEVAHTFSSFMRNNTINRIPKKTGHIVGLSTARGRASHIVLNGSGRFSDFLDHAVNDSQSLTFEMK